MGLAMKLGQLFEAKKPAAGSAPAAPAAEAEPTLQFAFSEIEKNIKAGKSTLF